MTSHFKDKKTEGFSWENLEEPAGEADVWVTGSLGIRSPALPVVRREKDQQCPVWRIKTAPGLRTGQMWPTKDTKRLVSLCVSPDSWMHVTEIQLKPA